MLNLGCEEMMKTEDSIDFKCDYVIRQLARISKKKFEHYAITRIWHLLNSLEYKIITQQYVYRGNGAYALTDLYFPQLKTHIEVDEVHHKNYIIDDKVREQDIIDATDHDILRVDCNKTLESINSQIDKIVRVIKSKKEALGARFIPWDTISEFKSITYIIKGSISIDDDVAFRRIVDAINCFGVQYKGFQKGGIKHPQEPDTEIWFPKLYKNNGWENIITADELTIYEKPIDSDIVISHIEKVISVQAHQRIVFARVIDSLGMVLYRFKGKFELNIDKSRHEKCLVWERISTEVKTYEYKQKQSKIQKSLDELQELCNPQYHEFLDERRVADIVDFLATTVAGWSAYGDYIELSHDAIEYYLASVIDLDIS